MSRGSSDPSFSLEASITQGMSQSKGLNSTNCSYTPLLYVLTMFLQKSTLKQETPVSRELLVFTATTDMPVASDLCLVTRDQSRHLRIKGLLLLQMLMSQSFNSSYNHGLTNPASLENVLSRQHLPKCYSGSTTGNTWNRQFMPRKKKEKDHNLDTYAFFYMQDLIFILFIHQGSDYSKFLSFPLHWKLIQ